MLGGDASEHPVLDGPAQCLLLGLVLWFYRGCVHATQRAAPVPGLGIGKNPIRP